MITREKIAKNPTVLIESPYRYICNHHGEKIIGLLRNITYARLCIRDSLMKGEAPWCSHLFYTQNLILNDENQDERLLGIYTGLSIGKKFSKSIFYEDLGWTNGMSLGQEECYREKREIEKRSLGELWKNAQQETPKETLLRLKLYTPEKLDFYQKEQIIPF